MISSVRGIPFWGAILLAIVCTAAGGIYDEVAHGTIGWGIRIGFLIGAVLAPLAVQRKGIFTAMVQPPLVYLGVTLLLVAMLGGGTFKIRLLGVVDIFPTMAIGTGAAVLLGLIRVLAQPLRQRPSGGQRRTVRA